VAYVIAEDKDAYYLPSVLVLALAAGFGAQAILARVRPAASAAAAAALALLPVLPLATGFAYADRSRYFIAEDYVSNTLATVAPGGMLLTGDWQLYSPLLYFREVEAKRRDAVSIDIHLLRRSWYFDYLERQFPETIARARPQVSTFVEELVAWEKDPALYARSPDLTQRINGRFLAMLKAFVDTHPGPIYATRDAVLPGLASDPDVVRTLTAGRTLVPQGLVFELASGRPPSAPQAVRLETLVLFDGSIPFEQDDVVSVKVKPVYLSMIGARGAYLEAMGDHRGAAAAFEEALALDPAFAPARDALERNRRAHEAPQPRPSLLSPLP
jgi:tetratricopeptide (TPR) repeat protein